MVLFEGPRSHVSGGQEGRRQAQQGVHPSKNGILLLVFFFDFTYICVPIAVSFRPSRIL